MRNSRPGKEAKNSKKTQKSEESHERESTSIHTKASIPRDNVPALKTHIGKWEPHNRAATKGEIGLGASPRRSTRRASFSKLRSIWPPPARLSSRALATICPQYLTATQKKMHNQRRFVVAAGTSSVRLKREREREGGSAQKRKQKDETVLEQPKETKTQNQINQYLLFIFLKETEVNCTS